VRFCVLASGSSGNAVCIESENTKLLVDCGLSGKEITKRLIQRGVNPAHLDGILVTHEHHDHILGVGVLSRKFDLPVYIHPRTLAASKGRMGWLPRTISFETGGAFQAGAFSVAPFSIPHDAAYPVGFTFSSRGKKLGLATDMGFVPEPVKGRLKDVQALILESNHDLKMLQEGPYAWSLKQRVMSRHGHLSNVDAGKLLGELIHRDLENVVLAHISKVNNDPRLAYRTAEAVIRQSGEATILGTVRQGETGSWIEVQHASRNKRKLHQPPLL